MKAEERHTVPHRTAIKLEPGDKIVLTTDRTVEVDHVQPMPYGIVRIYHSKYGLHIDAGRRYVFKLVRDETPVEIVQ